MARAMGARAKLIGAVEGTYGTAASSGFLLLPMFSTTLSAEQPLQDSPVIGYGQRDAVDPTRDVVTVDGDVVIPVDLRIFGHWLKLLFGAPSTTNASSVYTHVFTSGSWSLPSMTIEKGFPEVPSFDVYTGVMANTLAMQFQRSGDARATIALVAQGESAGNGTTLAGSPTSLTLEKFNAFQGAIKRGGNAIAGVTAANFTYSNNLERVETIRSDGLIDGADPSRATLSGSMDVRFADTTLLGLATAGTPVDLEFSYTISSTKKLTIAFPRVMLPIPRRPIPGPQGIQTSFDWQAAKGLSGPMATITLVNDVTSYA